MIIRLSESEYNYLCVELFANKSCDVVCSVNKLGDSYLLEVAEEQADVIRDLCGDRLQLVGFDEGYKLTQEGRILESLVDKFFIG